jgi:hypothetical protein
MMNFEAFKYLFEFLNVYNYLQKQWPTSIGWTMIKVMHKIILCAIKVVCKT